MSQGTKPFLLLLSNVRQVANPTLVPGQEYRSLGDDQLKIMEFVDIGVGRDGRILGMSGTAENQFNKDEFEVCVNGEEFVLIPGFVDAHTHALFEGDRSDEYDMKIQGKTYAEIFEQGLGISYTVREIRKTPLEILEAHLIERLKGMSRLGTTTVEVKSGYGLDTESEMKMLKAIKEVGENREISQRLTVVSTFCGAHAVPRGSTADIQTKLIIEEQIPALKAAMDRRECNPTFIDVFVEKGFFNPEQSEHIMLAGKKIGLTPSFHGDELSNLESGTLAAKVSARAISHL